MSRFYKVGIILISIMILVAYPASVNGQTDGNVGSFVLTPNSGPGCAIVNATGSGFPANWLVDLNWNPPNDVLLATGTTDANGNFNLSFTVPNVSPGDYPVIANVSQPQPPCPVGCPATSPSVHNIIKFVVTGESVQSNAYCAQVVSSVDTLPSTGLEQPEWFLYILIPIAGLAGFMMIKKWRRA